MIPVAGTFLHTGVKTNLTVCLTQVNSPACQLAVNNADRRKGGWGAGGEGEEGGGKDIQSRSGHHLLNE